MTFLVRKAPAVLPSLAAVVDPPPAVSKDIHSSFTQPRPCTERCLFSLYWGRARVSFRHSLFRVCERDTLSAILLTVTQNVIVTDPQDKSLALLCNEVPLMMEHGGMYYACRPFPGRTPGIAPFRNFIGQR